MIIFRNIIQKPNSMRPWYYLILASCLLHNIISLANSTPQQNPQQAISSEAINLQQQLDHMKQQIAALEDRQQALLKTENLAQPSQPNYSVVENATFPAEKTPVFEATNEQAEDVTYGYPLLANLGGTAVITSPFIHARYDFRGSGLLINYSSIDKDVAALSQRRDFYNQMRAAGLVLPRYPILELSGRIEGEFRQYRLWNGREGNAIDLSGAELDMQALVNDWFLGFMSFAYDNSPTDSGNRINNSSLYLDNGFITLGNLNKIPYYATIGQIYVPFGQFSSYLISDPLNKIIFRTKARALSIGYQSLQGQGFYGALFGFQGPTREGYKTATLTVPDSSYYINTFGGNIGYAYTVGPLSGLIGGSIINNVADSLGMQSTDGPYFGGFATSAATEVLAHPVPGYDLRAEMNYEPFVLIAEYTAATRGFSPLDLTFNGQGAKPAGYHLEAIYKFDMFQRPSNLALGYGRSFEALALNVPQYRGAIALNTAIWKNTLLSLEYRQDVNYAQDDTASGSNGGVFSPVGKNQNVVTAHFDIYF